jgi:hypothetical protein
MTSISLEQSIGKAFVNEDFRNKWYSDFDRICEQHNIPSDEHEEARRYLNKIMNVYVQQEGNTFQYRNVVSTEIFKLGQEVQKYAFEVLKSSIESSRKTYSRISYMSYIMFGVGIFLFALSAITGLLQRQEVFSIAFGLFGIASFVSFFIFSPAKNVQKALSNLLKAEIIFMNFWDQLHFWAPYGTSEDPDKKQKGSTNLQEATKEVVDMLDKYIQDKDTWS